MLGEVERVVDRAVARLNGGLEYVIDEVMERLIFAQPSRATMPRAKWEMFPDSVFDNIELIEAGDAERVYLLDVTPEVIWPVDQCMASWKEGHLLVCRMATCDPRELRNRARMVPRHVAWLHTAHYHDDGSFDKERIPVGYIGKAWRALDVGLMQAVGPTTMAARKNDARTRQEIDTTCMLALSAELTNRYEWSVTFRIDDSPSLRVCTDASGIRALVKNRDLGNRRRRDALKHWVSEHHRRHRVDPDAEVFVREHMRGAEAFRWCGYDCRVHVSAYDQERAQFAIDQRERRYA